MRKRRIDGRTSKDIRPISSEVGVLPRTHGSALFNRGETQALAVVTLGTSADEQRIDFIGGEEMRSFMLHYNFPPYSVGEAKASAQSRQKRNRPRRFGAQSSGACFAVTGNISLHHQDCFGDSFFQRFVIHGHSLRRNSYP